MNVNKVIYLTIKIRNYKRNRREKEERGRRKIKVRKIRFWEKEGKIKKEHRRI